MDEFYPPPNENMVPPFIQPAVRSNPPTRAQNSLPGWLTGESSIKVTEAEEEKMRAYGGPDFILYYYPHSFFSQKVMMALHEKGLNFKERLVNINLGEQFHDDFLSINPKAEVPVLRDVVAKETICDSNAILEYLEGKHNPRIRQRKLVPEVEPWKSLHDEFVQKLSCLRIDALTLGSSYFGRFYTLDPHYPYNYTPARLQLQEIALQRVNVLRREAERVAESNPEASAQLTLKADLADQEGPIMKDVRQFENVFLDFEKVCDACEAQLQHNWIDEDNPTHWLICPFITHADIILALTLNRLWQLGFEEKIFTENRPQLKIYYQRMKEVHSFKSIVTAEPEFNVWPYVIGIAGCCLLFAFEALWRRRRS